MIHSRPSPTAAYTCKYTLAFVLITEIKLYLVSNFSVAFGQSTQNRLTRSDTDPTPTLASVSCRHGWRTESEEFEQLSLACMMGLITLYHYQGLCSAIVLGLHFLLPCILISYLLTFLGCSCWNSCSTCYNFPKCWLIALWEIWHNQFLSAFFFLSWNCVLDLCTI